MNCGKTAVGLGEIFGGAVTPALAGAIADALGIHTVPYVSLVTVIINGTQQQRDSTIAIKVGARGVLFRERLARRTPAEEHGALSNRVDEFADSLRLYGLDVRQFEVNVPEISHMRLLGLWVAVQREYHVHPCSLESATCPAAT